MLYAVVFWGGSLTENNRKHLDKSIPKVDFVMGRPLVSGCSRKTVHSVLDWDGLPLHPILTGWESSCSYCACRTQRFIRQPLRYKIPPVVKSVTLLIAQRVLVVCLWHTYTANTFFNRIFYLCFYQFLYSKFLHTL